MTILNYPNRPGRWRIIWPSGKKGDVVTFTRLTRGELGFTLTGLDDNEEADRWLVALSAGVQFEEVTSLGSESDGE